MSLREAVASEMRIALARNNQSQREFAGALGISVAKAGLILRGDQPATTNHIESAADFLGVPVTVLLGATAKEARR